MALGGGGGNGESDFQNPFQEIKISLVELSVRLRGLEKQAEDIKAQLEKIEDKQTNSSVALGKLEVKNGILASAVGALSGFLSSKFGG